MYRHQRIRSIITKKLYWLFDITHSIEQQLMKTDFVYYRLNVDLNFKKRI